MWTCPKCGTKIDPSFDTCWSCGTTADGVEDPTFVTADADPSPAAESPFDLDMPEGEKPIPEPAELGTAELVECYLAGNIIEAKFLADQLSEAGIPAVSDVHNLQDITLTMDSFPRVYVRLDDLPAARAWLADYDRHKAAEHAEKAATAPPDEIA